MSAPLASPSLLTVRSPRPINPPPRIAPLPVPATPLLDVVGAGTRVPLVTGGSVRQVTLDHAATTPALTVVADAVRDLVPLYAGVHRGAGYASRVSTDLHDAARAEIGVFVGAREDDVVVLTRNTTDALNLLARAAPEGTVVFLDLEHHANQLPWQARRHHRVPVAPSVEETLDRLDRALIAEPAVLLAVTGASNVTGDVTPLDDIVALAHSHRVRVAVDAAQLAPHRGFSLASGGADYVALSGHKLYAPFGAGALVGRRDWLDAAPPYLLGGGAVEESGRGLTFRRAPERHEAGTPNLPGIVALATACAALSQLEPGALRRHEEALLAHLDGTLRTIPGVTVHRLWPERERVGSVAFTVDGWPAGLVAAVLGAEHGIGVRDGRFCAFALTHRLGLDEGAVRASVGLGSVGQDVDRLVTALARLVSDGPAWDYVPRDGRWLPQPDPRPLPAPPWR